VNKEQGGIGEKERLKGGKDTLVRDKFRMMYRNDD